MYSFTGITPVHSFGKYWVKREDLAYWRGLGHPSGSKVRQYLKMIKEKAPILIGCSASSCMSIYAASVAGSTGVKVIIYTAKRKVRSAAIEYAVEMGAEVVECKAAYSSAIQYETNQRAKQIDRFIEWNKKLALKDVIDQCVNIPKGVRRIVVPSYSGVTAAGVLAGVAEHFNWNAPPKIVVIATSTKVKADDILRMARTVTLKDLKTPSVINALDSHNAKGRAKWALGKLPDGTPLDPYFAAKAPPLQEGDLLWPAGLRPVKTMPPECRDYFKSWKGPQNDGMDIVG